MEKESEKYDVIIIGGGPAGMMSAITASKQELKVLLIEKNRRLGEKLLITGGGRCNITNKEYDNKKLLKKFKEAEPFLYSPFSQFAVKDTLDFFNLRGMKTKVEALGRVFPESNKAESVWLILTEELKKSGVEIKYNSPVKGFVKEGGKITGVKLSGNKIINASNFILATGGKSRPETGSTGEGFLWLKDIGHNVVEPNASLVPISIKDSWVKKLQGVTLPMVKITILQNNEKQDTKKGKILFTHFGISGPTILNLSRDIDELLKYGDVGISLDILPNLDHGQLNTKLQEIFKEQSNKKFKNSLGDLIIGSIVPVVVELTKIDGEKPVNSITREERMKIIGTLKNMKMSVESLLGIDKAIITSGGVDLKEVDFKTMQSKLYPNLYLIGDILDIDRPSGGYSLQLCWTTGFVAGKNVN